MLKSADSLFKWHTNIGSRFIRFVSKRACNGKTGRQTDSRTNGRNFDSLDRACICIAQLKPDDDDDYDDDTLTPCGLID